MKTKSFLIASGAVLALGALTSCSNDKSQEPSNDQTLHFYVAGVETRTDTGDINKTNIEEGNTVGIFGISSTETVTNGTNNKHTVGSDGSLTSSTSMIAKERSSLKVFAYAPHNSSWDDHATAQTFTVASDQSDLTGYLASDLLYAEGTSISKLPANQPAIGLTFEHKMARLILEIQTEEDSDDLSAASVTVNNTLPSCTFKPEDGSLGTATGSPIDITALSTLEGNTTVYAIIVPQTVSSETVLFTIEKTDKKYTLTLAQDGIFTEGNSYTYTVNVKPSPAKDVNIILSTAPTVTDWTEVIGESSDAVESQL